MRAHRRRITAGGAVLTLVVLMTAGSARAWDLTRPPECQGNAVYPTNLVDFALNATELYNGPALFTPASTSAIVHTIHLLDDVLAAKRAIDDVGDSWAFVPYNASTWPVRRPVDVQNIQDSDYPLSGDGRSEIGFIPIFVNNMAFAALPMLIYDVPSCGIVEADVQLSTFFYWWAFQRPGDHGESAYDAGLCVGGAIRPGLGCGLLSPSEPMFVRPVLVHMLLAVLGFDANIGVHSFRNNGTYPWQPGTDALHPDLVLLPDDRAGLRAQYPVATPTGEVDIAVVNTNVDDLDLGRNKLLCRPGFGWLSAGSIFDEYCSRTPPPATVCAGDVVNAKFSIVNNGTMDVTVTPALRFAFGLAGWGGEPRITAAPVTIPAGTTHLVEIRQYLPPGLHGGSTYGIWGQADTGVTIAQETNTANNLTPLRGSVTMGPGCDT
jgi:hypothetical protein